MSWQDIWCKVSGAYADYYKIKAQKDNWETWIGQLITVQAQAKNVKKAQLWQQLYQQEKPWLQAGQVKQALGQGRERGGLSQVDALAREDSTKWVSIFLKEKLECTCLAKAKQQFTQAAATPLLHKVPQGLDSMSGGSWEFLQILEGNYPVHTLSDPFIIKLLKQLKKPKEIQEVEAQMPTKYWCGWKIAQETTSSSLLGLHFSHYMAGIKDLTAEKINQLMATIPMITRISPVWSNML